MLLAAITSSNDLALQTPFVSIGLGSIFATALVQIMLIFFGVVTPLTAVAQIGLDLVLLGAVVSASGGASSPFAFLFCIIVLEAALTLPRRGTLTTAVLAALTLIGLGGPVTSLASLVAAVMTIGFLASTLTGQARRAQHALARLGNLHERVLNGLTSGVITTDKRGRIGFINPAGLAILKRTAVVGDFLERVSPELAKLTPEQLDRGEVEIDGLTVGVSAVPLYDAHNVVIGHTLIFRDLTAIRATERERQLATVGRLAANLAHEVRNPLGSVSGSVDMIAQNPRLDADERALVGIVQREVERLNKLISDFLEYARPSAAERGRFDLTLLAEETVVMYRQDPAAASVAIARTGVASAVFGMFDPGQVRQILLNLLKNAVQTGVSDIEVRVESDARVSVWNEGQPIAEPERLFEPFFTTKPGGSGLGLPLVQQLARANGGEIRVKHDGKRVGFELALPLA